MSRIAEQAADLAAAAWERKLADEEKPRNMRRIHEIENAYRAAVARGIWPNDRPLPVKEA